jgi:hypothetical protein
MTVPAPAYATGMEQDQPYVAPFLRRLMTGASEEQILEASENLRGYLRAMYAIYLRQERTRRERDSRASNARDRFPGDGAQPHV